MAEKNTNEKHKAVKKKQLGSIAKYSGMAFQMIAIMLLFAFIGLKLDAYLGKSPLFIVIFTLLGVLGAMASVVRDLLKMK